MILTKNNAFPFSEYGWNTDDQVAFSPDSHYLLSFSRNENSILIWNLSSGRLVQSLIGHKKGYENRIAHAAFLPSCLHVVSLSEEGELFVWDLRDGTYKDMDLIKGEMYPYFQKTTQMSVSSDGSSVYLFDTPYFFQMIDLHEKKESRYFNITPHTGIKKAVFLSDGTLFLYVKNDQIVYELHELFSDDRLETSSCFNIKVWAGQFGNRSRTGISISKYGNYVAESYHYYSGDDDDDFFGGEINIWNLNAQTIVRSLKIDESSIGATMLSSNGRYFSDGVTVWSTFSGEEVFKSKWGSWLCWDFSPDERYVFTQFELKSMAYIADLENSNKNISVIGGHGYCDEVYIAGNCVLSNDGEYFYAWSLDSGSIRYCLNLNEAGDSQRIVFLSRDGRFAITRQRKWVGGEFESESSLCLWQLTSGALVFECKNFQEDAVVLTPDNKYLLSSRLLLDIDRNKAVRKFEGHEEYCDPICLSSNGYLVLSGCTDGSIILWSLLTGDEICRFKSPQQSSFSIFDISPNNKWFMSLGKEKGIQVWNLADKDLHQILDEDKAVFCASFLMGDDYIISCGEDNKVKFWHVQTGQLVYEVEQTEKILSLSISSDGKKIYLGSKSGVSTWDFQIEKISDINT